MRVVSEQWLSFAIDLAMEDADERGMTIKFPFAAEQVARIYTYSRHPSVIGS